MSDRTDDGPNLEAAERPESVSGGESGRIVGPSALKERAGVVDALVDGRQTVLLRSADLPPEGDDLEEPFALYPSYSHQDPDRYDPSDVGYYHRSTTKPAEGIPLRAIAEVVAERTIGVDRLAALEPHYVYTEAGLRDKYRLEDGGTVRALLLRVHRLRRPRLVEERPAYRGCRTWIDLGDAVAVDPAATTPAIDDAAFAERRAALESVFEAHPDGSAVDQSRYSE